MAGPFGTIPETIANWADQVPDRIAIFAINREPISYEDLVRQARIIQGALAIHGVSSNRRVALAIHDRPSLALAVVGTHFHCSTAVPINPAGTLDEIKSYLSILKIGALLTDAKTNSPVVSAAKNLGITTIELEPETQKIGVRFDTDVAAQSSPQCWPDPSDIAYLATTSGTTGRKIVPKTHDEVIWNFQRKNTMIIKNGEEDICLNPLSLFFSKAVPPL